MRDDLAGWPLLRSLAMSNMLLTKRRAVDLCRVGSCLCRPS
jgi:hypothetical protein